MTKFKYFAAFIIPLLGLLTFNTTGVYAYTGLFFLYVLVPISEQLLPKNTYNLNNKWSSVEDVFNFAFVYDSSVTYSNLVNFDRNLTNLFSSISSDKWNLNFLNNFDYNTNSTLIIQNSDFINVLASNSTLKNNTESAYKFFP